MGVKCNYYYFFYNSARGRGGFRGGAPYKKCVTCFFTSIQQGPKGLLHGGLRPCSPAASFLAIVGTHRVAIPFSTIYCLQLETSTSHHGWGVGKKNTHTNTDQPDSRTRGPLAPIVLVYDIFKILSEGPPNCFCLFSF